MDTGIYYSEEDLLRLLDHCNWDIHFSKNKIFVTRGKKAFIYEYEDIRIAAEKEYPEYKGWDCNVNRMCYKAGVVLQFKPKPSEDLYPWEDIL